ncbi:uncharacterized protein Dana_GF27426, isoform A [Drosophila ananassae]|uniref:Uncharacterized protein, isoform A n=1 Tax=Drosophila ananassae TaxID=7217 RepID=A0A0P8Y0S6_DROAN|nr:uncharacterized protein Dana_GF27426, isoform A [Drosophila ananassae]
MMRFLCWECAAHVNAARFQQESVHQVRLGSYAHISYAHICHAIFESTRSDFSTYDDFIRAIRDGIRRAKNKNYKEKSKKN